MELTMIKYVIHAKLWRDKTNGNTYHSANVLDTKRHLMLPVPMHYGYGDQFIQSASNAMLKNNWIDKHLVGIDYKDIHFIVEPNCKKKDVHDFGGGLVHETTEKY
jgi:exopolysaccharide biosynthesis predicted pyruvyltransferase EpsI